jgi:hypothetical protein
LSRKSIITIVVGIVALLGGAILATLQDHVIWAIASVVMGIVVSAGWFNARRLSARADERTDT